MSLINDALKRASKPRLSGSSPAVTPSMRPADRSSAKGLPRFFLPISLLIFTAAVWILFKGIQTQQALTAAAAPVHVAAREGQPPPPPPELLEAIAKEHPEFRPVADKILRNDLTPAKPQERPAFTVPEAPRPPQLPTSTTVAPLPSPSVAPVNPESLLPPPIQPQPGSVNTSPSAYKLGGIIYRPSKPAAVINNRTVYVGDRVGSARVKSIHRDAVVLQLPDGKELELLLN